MKRRRKLWFLITSPNSMLSHCKALLVIRREHNLIFWLFYLGSFNNNLRSQSDLSPEIIEDYSVLFMLNLPIMPMIYLKKWCAYKCCGYILKMLCTIFQDASALQNSITWTLGNNPDMSVPIVPNSHMWIARSTSIQELHCNILSRKPP